MMNVPENELFSAYLDGELTAEEQAKVEELLAASPAARQLMDELRALSTSLQALPAYQLHEDLSERVLRLAERRMLAEPAAAKTPDRRPRPVEPGWRSIGRRVFQPRALVWSGLAVAVALILMVTERQQPQQPAGDRIAIAPQPAKTPAAGPSIQAVEEPAEEAERPAPEALVEEARPAALEEEPEPGREDAGKAAADKAETVRTRKAAPVDRPAEQAAPAPQTPPPGAVAEPSQPPSGPRPAAEPKPPSGQQRPASEPAIVVECTVSPEAARQGLFDEILARQKIARIETADSRTADRPTASKPPESETNASLQADQATPEVICVEVEATPAQLRATLAELKARPKDFPAVSPGVNLGRVTLRTEGLRIGGRTTAGRSLGTGQFLSESAPAAGSSIRLGTATGKAAVGRSHSFRMQIGAQGVQRAATPADQTVEAEARARTAPAQAKPDAKPPADQAAPKDEQVPERDAGASARTDRGLPKSAPPRTVPKYRVRFVLRIADPAKPAAEKN